MKKVILLGLFSLFTMVGFAEGNTAHIQLIKTIYNTYVFGGKDFSPVARTYCTKKLADKLRADYDYDCFDGDCYAIWKFRTDNQEGPSNDSRIVSITPLANNWYKVVFKDMGWNGTKYLKIVVENGRPKVDIIQNRAPGKK